MSDKKIILKKGANNQPIAVTAIQTGLAHLGFYHGEMNGVFNEATEKAVKEFQQAMGLPANGMVDEKTDRVMVPALEYSKYSKPLDHNNNETDYYLKIFGAEKTATLYAEWTARAAKEVEHILGHKVDLTKLAWHDFDTHGKKIAGLEIEKLPSSVTGGAEVTQTTPFFAKRAAKQEELSF